MTAVAQQFGGLSCLVVCFKWGIGLDSRQAALVTLPTVILSDLDLTTVRRDLSILSESF